MKCVFLAYFGSCCRFWMGIGTVSLPFKSHVGHVSLYNRNFCQFHLRKIKLKYLEISSHWNPLKHFESPSRTTPNSEWKLKFCFKQGFFRKFELTTTESHCQSHNFFFCLFILTLSLYSHNFIHFSVYG